MVYEIPYPYTIYIVEEIVYGILYSGTCCRCFTVFFNMIDFLERFVAIFSTGFYLVYYSYHFLHLFLIIKTDDIQVIKLEEERIDIKIS